MLVRRLRFARSSVLSIMLNAAPHTLLIVDDCPEDRAVYREYLSSDPQCSYRFIEAPRAEVGLDIFQQQCCDAILLDFWMPDMDGLEFLDELQRRQLKSSPPVIMLTGQGNEALAVKAMKQGIQDYLVKQHLQPEVLQLAVRNVIQQSQLHTLLSKTRERQRLIATTALRIRQSLDLDQILNTVVAEIQQLLECDHVAVYQKSADQKSTDLNITNPKSAGQKNVVLKDTDLNITNQKNTSFPLTIRAELGTRYTLHVIDARDSEADLSHCQTPDAKSDSRQILDRVDHVNEDIIAPIFITPPTSQSRHTWGYLVAHQAAKKTPWTPEEQAIVNELTVQLAIAIQQAELLHQTQQALEKSQDLNHFKSQIIATVSHEYRTPLATILASASTLDNHHDRITPERRSHFLKMIQAKARHMAKLVDDMLAVHQCELNQAQFEPAPINLLQFLANLIEEYRENVQDSHEFRFSVSGRIHTFWGDAGMLRIAIDNLLSNAVKYSLPESLIEVTVTGTESAVTLSVQDQGIGIPAAEQSTLFQSFRRASNVGNIAGTGLGLAIVKACVDLHSGEIALSSEEHKGTQISITLPNSIEAVKQRYASTKESPEN